MHEKFNKILYYKTSRESLTVLCSVMKHLGSSLQVCVASISKCSSSLVFILDYSLKREGWAGLMLFYLYPPFLIFHSLLTTPPPNLTPPPPLQNYIPAMLASTVNVLCRIIYLFFLLSSSHKILDVGSGLGGPARHMAHTTNCSVTCLELQEDLHSEGQDLTRRCNLQEKVTHISGDFLKMDLGQWMIYSLHPNISMHILHTVLYTYPEVLMRRICIAIKSFFCW